MVDSPSPIQAFVPYLKNKIVDQMRPRANLGSRNETILSLTGIYKVPGVPGILGAQEAILSLLLQLLWGVAPGTSTC